MFSKVALSLRIYLKYLVSLRKDRVLSSIKSDIRIIMQVTILGNVSETR